MALAVLNWYRLFLLNRAIAERYNDSATCNALKDDLICVIKRLRNERRQNCSLLCFIFFTRKVCYMFKL